MILHILILNWGQCICYEAVRSCCQRQNSISLLRLSTVFCFHSICFGLEFKLMRMDYSLSPVLGFQTVPRLIGKHNLVKDKWKAQEILHTGIWSQDHALLLWWAGCHMTFWIAGVSLSSQFILKLTLSSESKQYKLKELCMPLLAGLRVNESF